MKQVFSYATPEEVGVSSEDILNLINELEEAELYTHSLMIIKNGKIVWQGRPTGVGGGFLGFTSEGKFILGKMSAEEALAYGLIDGVITKR